MRALYPRGYQHPKRIKPVESVWPLAETHGMSTRIQKKMWGVVQQPS